MRQETKEIRRFVVHVLEFAAGMVLLCEFMFTVVFPSSHTPYVVSNDEFGIHHYDTTGHTTGTVTRGRFGEKAATWKVNNYGWISDTNYRGPDERDVPSIVVIGDSYIQGIQGTVVYAYENVTSVLQGMLNDRYDVYNLGAGGTTSYGYVHVARYAAHHFDPEVIVVSMTSGDLHLSIGQTGIKPPRLRQQLAYQDGQFIHVTKEPYRPSILSRVLRFSALVRYLRANRSFHPKIETFEQSGEPETAQDTSASPVLAGVARHIVKMFTLEHPDRKLIFIVDADRRAIYASPDVKPDPIPTYDYIKAACDEFGVSVVDLTDGFFADYSKNRKQFESMSDPHWNGLGHRVVARAIYRELTSLGLAGTADTRSRG